MTNLQKEILAVIDSEGGYKVAKGAYPAIRALAADGLVKQGKWPDLRYVRA